MRLSRRRLIAGMAALSTAPAYADSRLMLTASQGLQSWTAMRDGLAQMLTREHSELGLTWWPGSDDWDITLQETLRESIVNALPDVSHQSLNNVRMLSERGVAVPLDPFLGKAGGWAGLGYLQTLQAAARRGDSTFAVPFATTIPVLFVNMDLARAAGFQGNEPPIDWPGILDLAKRINDGPDHAMGIFVEYDATSAWIFQCLLMSNGGRMMSPNEKEVLFDGPEGLAALELTRQFGLAGHRDMTNGQARQSFSAGRTGIHVRSASGIKPVKDAVAGHFELTVGAFPIPSPSGRLPGAGNGIVMLTRDPERQRAAWEYMVLATTVPGQTIVAETSGYLPTNARTINDPAGLGGFYADHHDYRAVIDRLPMITDWFAFPGNGSVRIFKMMIDEQRAVIIGQEKPADALARMAASARKILAEG